MPMKNANPQIEESEALRKKALREVAATKEVIEESRQILDKTQQTLDEVRAKRQPRGGESGYRQSLILKMVVGQSEISVVGQFANCDSFAG